MSTIPLHQLPNEAFLRVIRSMEIYDQLAYSLCSQNTKKVIKSLNLKAKEINFYVADWVELEICFENIAQIYYHLKNGYYYSNNKIIARQGIEISVNAKASTEWKWNLQVFEFQNWLHHFCEVLHHPKIDMLAFSGHIDDDSIAPVEETVKSLKMDWLFLCELSTSEFTRKVLDSFQNYENIWITQIPFDKHMSRVFIQNLKRVSIEQAQKISIDQVLSSNCEDVQLTDSTLTREEFRILVKSWIRGSNPRLKYFSACRRLLPTQMNPPFDEKVFFKGIKYTNIPLDSEEVYRHGNDHIGTKLAGGFRIRRFDGTNAVVMIYERMFELIVV